MKRKLSAFGCLLLFIQFAANAQMKVGDHPSTINKASLLELESTNKGFVFPSISLTNVTSAAPLATGLLTGTVVYNINGSITGGNGTGLYVWNGTLWMYLSTGSTSSTGWSLTGNTGTNYSNNFLGTTDNVGLRMRTNNIQRILADSVGSVAIGSEAFDANNRERFLVDYGTTTSHTIARFKGSINSYLQVDVQNTSAGNNATSKFTARADDGTDSTFIIHMGINNSPYSTSSGNWGTAHDAYLYSSSKNLLFGVKDANSDITFLAGGGDVKANSVLRIVAPSGNIAVGKGDISDAPVGNTIRGPNGSGTNITGGNLTLSGGKSTGTATGGSIIINGGSTDTGPLGAVNINTGKNGFTNINTGASASDVTIGGKANNIILPKYSTVGGLYYTALSSGQISTTGANLTWDSINNRLGIGVPTPQNKLSVVSAADPLFLAGVQATSSFTTDSVLTIFSGVVKKAPYSSILNSISAIAPLTYTNGVLGITQASTSSNGYVSSTDWNIFNNKVSSIALNTPSVIYTGPVNFNVSNGAATGNLLLRTQSPNTVLAGPASGTTAVTPTFRALVSADFNTSAWTLIGNSGTNSSTNFIGTTDGLPLVFRTNNTERMRMLSTGSVGIGTTNPLNALSIIAPDPLYLSGLQTTVTYAADSLLVINAGVVKKAPTGSGAWSTTGNAGISISTNFLGTTDGQPLVFRTNNAERMRMLSTGNIGIGTINPLNALSIIATNPLYLSGLTPISSVATSDSVLTIASGVVKKAPSSLFLGSGWLTTGNSGTSSGTNFIGTTDQQGLTFKVNNVQAGFLGLSGSSYATSFGVGSSAVYQSTAIGAGAQATGSNASLAVGYQAIAANQNAIAIGTSSGTTADEVIVIGPRAKGGAYRGVAIGADAQVSGSTQNIAIGYNSNASSFNGIAIGLNAAATTNNNTLAIGASAQATGFISLAIGNGATASGQNSSAFGASAQATGLGANAFGNSSTASGTNALVVGNSSISGGANAVALGDNSTASGDYAITIGNSAQATKVNSTVVGYNSTASGIGSSVYGKNSTASGDNSIVIGDNSSATGTATTIIANGITTAASDAIILGNAVKKIGIGTTTPAYKLTVVPQSGNDPFYLNGVQGLTTPVTTDSILAIRAGIVKQIRIADLPASANYIQNNQTTTGQTGGFNISGSGTIGTTLSVGSTSTFIGQITSSGGIKNTGGFSTGGGAVTLGNSGNIVVIPKFATVGGVFYTAKISGEIGNAAADMSWDDVNKRLGVGTATPTANLDVNGTFKLGTSGTILNNITKVATTVSLPLITALSTGTAIVTVSGATVGSTVIINPRNGGGWPAGVVIAYAYVSAVNTITIGLLSTIALSATPNVQIDVTTIQ